MPCTLLVLFVNGGYALCEPGPRPPNPAVRRVWPDCSGTRHHGLCPAQTLPHTYTPHPRAPGALGALGAPPCGRYHGRDVDSIVRDLVEAALSLVRTRLKQRAKAQVWMTLCGDR